MWNTIKKDFVIISRDRSEILLLLGMPLILITILGLALGGLMFDEPTIEPINVALIDENSLSEDLEKLNMKLQDEGVPDETAEQLLQSAEDLDPVTYLLDLLADPEVRQVVALQTDLDAEAASTALEADQIDAVITVPEGFSYQTFAKVFFEEEGNNAIQLAIRDHEELNARVVENLLTSFRERYNLEISIALAVDGEDVETAIEPEQFGSSAYLTTQEPVTSFQYYTIGVAVMFALYVGSTVASSAFKEKQTNVLARLMVSGETSARYLTSKFFSAVVLTFLQLGILFSLSSLFFQTFQGKTLEFWLGVGLISLVFSLLIGGIGALLTSVSLSANNDGAANIFSGGIVTIFAFLGGSFIPVEQISPFIRSIGNWTPNGAMMTAYLQLIQGFEWETISTMLYRVIGMTAVLLIFAVAVFPKRRLA